jgi:hypothetical protein
MSLGRVRVQRYRFPPPETSTARPIIVVVDSCSGPRAYVVVPAVASVTPAWDQASEKHEQASLVGLQLRPVDCA